MHITPVDGNVFSDLGFEPDEAAALLAESRRIISQKLAIQRHSVTSPRGTEDDGGGQTSPPTEEQ